LLLGFVPVLVACGDPPADGLDTWGEPTSTGTSTSGTTGDPDTETGVATETDTGETDTGDDEPFDGLRFVAAASNSAVILGVDLDDPANILPPEYVSNGAGSAALLGPTPWGAEAVIHGVEVDQLRVSGSGEMQLSSLSVFESPWIEDLWFDSAGANAIATVSPSTDPSVTPNQLWWMTYDENGHLTGSYDITPPLQDGGAIFVPGRTDDFATILIDAEPDGVWEIYLLALSPEPGAAEQIDQIDLTGIPGVSVPTFLSLHIDDQRIAYRREVNPDVWRPVAVALDDPEASPLNLIVGFEHTYSIVWSEDGNRMLFTKGGESPYRELMMADFNGPLDANQEFALTEPGELALLDSLPPLTREAPGHGIDAQGRIWYAHESDPVLETVGISLAIVPFNGGLSDRVLLTDTPPGAVIGQIIWDADTQLLGYRTDSGGQSFVSYIDLAADQPVAIRVDQDFEYFVDEPERNASVGWSAGRTHVAVAGIQGGSSTLHVTELGDPAGATLELALPDLSAEPGATVEHRPLLSPDGDRIMLWFGTDSLRGLIHTPTDGSVPATIVVPLQHQLSSGTYIPREPSAP
jgi:hypothetical protein